MDCSPPGSSLHGLLQARILEWIAMPFSGESSQPRDQTPIFYSSCIGRWVVYTSATWEAHLMICYDANDSYQKLQEHSNIHVFILKY